MCEREDHQGYDRHGVEAIVSPDSAEKRRPDEADQRGYLEDVEDLNARHTSICTTTHVGSRPEVSEQLG